MGSALIYLLIALMWLIPVILLAVGVAAAVRWSWPPCPDTTPG